MKALPLWQPWATLIAVGAKRVETRHWPAPGWLIGQPIAIHATKTRDHLPVCRTEPFHRYELVEDALPLGALVATAVIARCAEITQALADHFEVTHPHEFAFGDYAPGRFAWVLRDVRKLASPVPFRGSQGLFEVPPELVGVEPHQEALAL